MKDQYRFVGPALFVLRTIPTAVEPVRHWRTREPAIPEEVWIEVLKTWVRLDGNWVSGWDGDSHFGFRPHWLNRWKIRCAARRFRRFGEGQGARG